MKLVRNLAGYREFEKAVHDRGTGGKMTARDWIAHPFFSQKLLAERIQRDNYYKSIVALTL